jgi:hypothetical protein
LAARPPLILLEFGLSELIGPFGGGPRPMPAWFARAAQTRQPVEGSEGLHQPFANQAGIPNWGLYFRTRRSSLIEGNIYDRGHDHD